jgi:hypothetical protein
MHAPLVPLLAVLVLLVSYGFLSPLALVRSSKAPVCTCRCFYASTIYSQKGL